MLAEARLHAETGEQAVAVFPSHFAALDCITMLKLEGWRFEQSRIRAVHASGGRITFASGTADAMRFRGIRARFFVHPETRLTRDWLDVIRACSDPRFPSPLAGQASPETRAVDPITDLRRLDRTVFLPPLPEQAQVAGPLSSAAASPAPS